MDAGLGGVRGRIKTYHHHMSRAAVLISPVLAGRGGSAVGRSRGVVRTSIELKYVDRARGGGESKWSCFSGESTVWWYIGLLLRIGACCYFCVPLSSALLRRTHVVCLPCDKHIAHLPPCIPIGMDNDV